MNTLNEQIAALLEETDQTAALGNVSACIMQSMDHLNWAGFYLVKNGELVLGPFQGLPACTHISFQRGVCGLTYRSASAQIVDDVLQCTDHIACDSASRSELCVPVIIHSQVMALIDLDSPVPSRFHEAEKKEMLQAAENIALAWIQHSWSVQR